MPDIRGHETPEQLREREERRFRALVSNAFDLIHIIDDENRVIWITDSLKRMLGYEPAEVVGRSCVSFVVPEDRPIIQAAFAEARDGKKPAPVRIGVRDRQGGHHMLEAVITDMRGDPDIGGLVINERDVTESWRAEQALRDSELQHRMVLKATNDIIYEWNLTRGVLRWNENLARLVGEEAESLETPIEWWTERIHPDQRERVNRSLFEAIDGGKRNWSSRYRFRGKGDEYVDLLDRGYILHDANGKAERMVGSMMDVTDLARKEAELQLAQDRFERAQKAARFGVWYSDPEDAGKLIWTSGCYDIFGIPASVFDGRVETFFKLVHPDDLPAVRSASRDALAGKRRYDVDHRVIRPDGMIRWVHQEADTLFDAAGKPTQMIGMVQDINDRKLAEQESSARAEELERTMRHIIGREQKMIELKRRVAELEEQARGKKRS